jgi:hypothetical protein
MRTTRASKAAHATPSSNTASPTSSSRPGAAWAATAVGMGCRNAGACELALARTSVCRRCRARAWRRLRVARACRWRAAASLARPDRCATCSRVRPLGGKVRGGDDDGRADPDAASALVVGVAAPVAGGDASDRTGPAEVRRGVGAAVGALDGAVLGAESGLGSLAGTGSGSGAASWAVAMPPTWTSPTARRTTTDANILAGAKPGRQRGATCFAELP